MLDILALFNNLCIRLVAFENGEVVTEPMRLKLVKLPSRYLGFEELVDLLQVPALFLR